MNLTKNSIHTVEIEDITNLGFGVAKINGNVVFVSGCVTGDVIECRIIKVGSNYSVGKVERVVRRSALYVCDRCESSTCKSCAYKNISYESELEIKTQHVLHEMKKAGLSHVRVLDTVPSPSTRHYRNKAQYPVASVGGEIAVGFYAPKSHRVTEAADCPLSPAVFKDIIECIREFIKKHGISVYDEKTQSGLIRHIYLRRAEVSEEILVTLVVNGNKLPKSCELVSTLTDKFPNIVGILLNENIEDTNIILGKNYTTLYGRAHIYDTLAGVELALSAPSFYQVNHGTAELIYAEVKRLAAPTKRDTVLDLYCGVGSIGLSLAGDAGEVIGIEIVADAVRCANENAKRCGIDNAKFFTGDATDTEKLLDTAQRELGRKITPSVIILDPPRAGCSEILLKYVSSLCPEKIVYVSCNPATLARDIKTLSTLGYTCNTVQPYDMFTMTGHVESVVCLTRE